jgi:hypothetical protein
MSTESQVFGWQTHSNAAPSFAQSSLSSQRPQLSVSPQPSGSVPHDAFRLSQSTGGQSNDTHCRAVSSQT